MTVYSIVQSPITIFLSFWWFFWLLFQCKIESFETFASPGWTVSHHIYFSLISLAVVWRQNLILWNTCSTCLNSLLTHLFLVLCDLFCCCLKKKLLQNPILWNTCIACLNSLLSIFSEFFFFTFFCCCFVQIWILWNTCITCLNSLLTHQPSPGPPPLRIMLLKRDGYLGQEKYNFPTLLSTFNNVHLLSFTYIHFHPFPPISPIITHYDPLLSLLPTST